MILLLLLSLSVGSFFAEAMDWKSVPAVRKNNKGIEYLEKDQPYPAYKEFLSGLQDQPLNPEIHLNLGLAYEKNKEQESALKEYLAAARLSSDKDTRFYALFNAAQLIAQANQIPQALAFYQKALELRPDSQEVKTNIELLWKGGGGKGDGESKDQQQQQQGQGKNDKQDQQGQNGQDQKQEQKKEPKPFQSHELTKEDVKKILEELKNQEQQIRARVYNDNAKEKPNGKDW